MTTVSNKYRGSKEYALVYTELITAAKYKGTVTYQEIAKIIGLPMQGNYMSKMLGQILGEISEDEVANRRPMLSAIALGVSGKPGKDFYELARQLGCLKEFEDELDFWKKERQQVYDTWKVVLTKP